MEAATSGNFSAWLAAHWGEAAAFAVVAAALLHLARKFFFRKKSAACCDSGCKALGGVQAKSDGAKQTTDSAGAEKKR